MFPSLSPSQHSPQLPPDQQRLIEEFEKSTVNVNIPKLIELRSRADYSTDDFQRILERFERYLNEKINDKIMTQALAELTQHLPYLANNVDLQKRIWELIKDVIDRKHLANYNDVGHYKQSAIDLASAGIGDVWFSIALYQTQSLDKQLAIEAKHLTLKNLSPISAHLQSWITSLDSGKVSSSDIERLQQTLDRLPLDTEKQKAWGQEGKNLMSSILTAERNGVKRKQMERIVAGSEALDFPSPPGVQQLLDKFKSRAQEIINQHQASSSSADPQRIV